MSQEAIHSNQKYEKLKNLLKELFQLDQPDLDFGLYRIMHAKSEEVTQFLDKDLLPQVQKAFGRYKAADKEKLENELANAIEQARSLGAEPETIPKVKELRSKLSDEVVDISGLENDVYDHLYSFFRRYYSEGDFLAKRVYRPGVYAIPYEGEEVKLYWANHDQYYIKTSEYVHDYAFRLRPNDEKNPMRVHFRISAAPEREHRDVKTAELQGRVFILVAEDFIVEEGGDLILRFAHRPATLSDWPKSTRKGKTKPPTQKDLNALTVSRVLGVGEASLAAWIAELAKPHITVTKETPGYSRLDGHLRRYTARNTFDYFIHKDLGGFLRRELQFYIKNEVMHLDDVENETGPRVEQYLSKIKVIRGVGDKIIVFLAQLEEFQKKLWLKKKFVVETEYCIRLDQIPDEFCPEIAQNAAQREEWVKLLALDEITEGAGPASHRVPLSKAFLKAHPSLPVDTRHFSIEFKEKLVSSFGTIAEVIDALLIDGENFQSLSLMMSLMRGRISTIYADPPYNTGGDGFMYRDNYKHSSWLSMISDRLALARVLMAEDGVLYASIDSNERLQLESALIEAFGADNRVEEIIWVQNTTKNQSPTYSTNHEYVEVFAKNLSVAKGDFRRFRETKPGLKELQELLLGINPSYPPIRVVEDKISELYRSNKSKKESASEDDPGDDWKGLYNYTKAEYRDGDGKLVLESEAAAVGARIWVWRESDTSMPQVKEDSQKPAFRDRSSPEFRFYKPTHPITGKKCPHPKRGWAWPLNQFGRQATSFSELVNDNRIVWGEDETKIPQKKSFVHETETNVSKSVVEDFTDGEKQLMSLFGKTRAFSNPKPTTLIKRFVEQTTWGDEWIMDFFAGSGTSGQAVIEANRKDGGRRKVCLVEPGEHFRTVLLPRIKKIIFTPEWKGGKPKRLATPEEVDRGPRIVKVIRIESVEDVLYNLDLQRTEYQEDLLAFSAAQGADGLNEQYLLRYMLDVETRGSRSLLSVKDFSEPNAYKMKIKQPGSDEIREVNVDLLETFNLLIGLTVRHIAVPQNFTAEFERDTERRLRIRGRLKQEANGPYWFRTVTGTTPDGRHTLIIWRNLSGNPEEDNLLLDTWFTRAGYSAKDSEFDLIYVNGDNNLENLKTITDTWKVRLIEEDFHRLMFATEGL
jgi:adenine-specific DNA-methyltransferase